MRVLAGVLLWAGRAYLAFAAFVIVIGVAGVLVRGGAWRLWEVANPLEPRNAFAVLVTLAPGLVLVWVAEWMGLGRGARRGQSVRG